MVEPTHFFLNNQHYQFKIDLTSDFDDQITWELPRSTQPLPRTIPSFNLDPPELDSNMHVA